MPSFTPAERKFYSAIYDAAAPDSYHGAKITKPEFEPALAELQKSHLPADLVVSAVTRATRGGDLSRTVRTAINKLIGTVEKSSPIAPEVKTAVRELFEAQRRSLAGVKPASIRIPFDVQPYHSFVLDDSRCPPHARCVWAGELWVAHVPEAGAPNSVSQGSPSQPAYVYFERTHAGERALFGPFLLPQGPNIHPLAPGVATQSRNI